MKIPRLVPALALFILIATGAATQLQTITPNRAPKTEIAPLSLISWNVKHLGRDNEDVETTAHFLQRGDVIAFQEVNISDKGRNALKGIAKHLAAKLQDTICEGLSEIPTGSKELYAFLWRHSRIAFVKADGTLAQDCNQGAFTIRLGVRNAEKIVREPAIATFEFLPDHKRFTFASIHLVPSGKRPQDEVEPLFDTLNEIDGPLVVAGDFNLDCRHPIFKKPIGEMKYATAFSKGEKTSLKMKKRELSKAYDNFFFRKMDLLHAKVINLYEELPSYPARDIYNNLSDHCPVRAEFGL